MTVKVRNIILTDLMPRWTGTATGYQMAYLSSDHKKSLGLPKSAEYAIRIDGSQCVTLVKCINGFSSYRKNAEVMN